MIKIFGWIAIKLLIHIQFADVSHLSTSQLASWSAQPPLLLDARTAPEYAVSHLPGAQLAPAQLQDLSTREGVDPSTPIVVYCSIGYRSAHLAQRLTAMGYENVFNLEGSIFQWANEDRPVYRGGNQVQEVHPFDRSWGTLLNKDLYPDDWQPIQ
ncbi:MAG: rhodanese-like domain-containing protein [Cyanophyceae cyanobacterium]